MAGASRCVAGYLHRKPIVAPEARVRMPKKLAWDDLPHLNPEQISERDGKESRLRHQMSKCWIDDEFDRERADHILRGFAVEIFEFELEAYLDKPGYESAWIELIAEESLTRVLLHAGSAYSQNEMLPLFERLKKTVLDYLRNHAILSVLSGFEGRGIRLKSPSAIEKENRVPPLSALRAHRPDPVSVIQPVNPFPNLNTGKRWSALIHSSVAVERMERYVRAKNLEWSDFASSAGTTDRTLRSFRKHKCAKRNTLAGIAKGMNMTLDELIKPDK